MAWVQGVAVLNFYERTAPVELRQSGDFAPLSLRAEQPAQWGFDQLGRCAALPCCFARAGNKCRVAQGSPKMKAGFIMRISYFVSHRFRG